MMNNGLWELQGIYQLDLNENIQLVILYEHSHITKSSCNKQQESAYSACLSLAFHFENHALTYLISSTFSATSMHIDERKRSHHESRYVAYKKKITTRFTVTKERGKNKCCEIESRVYFFFFQEASVNVEEK